MPKEGIPLEVRKLSDVYGHVRNAMSIFGVAIYLFVPTTKQLLHYCLRKKLEFVLFVLHVALHVCWTITSQCSTLKALTSSLQMLCLDYLSLTPKKNSLSMRK